MKISYALGAAALAAAMSPAHAGTIFDTGVPTGPAGYGIFNVGPSAYNGMAARFTLTQTTRITGIEGWFQSAPAGNDEVVFALHADVDGVAGQAFGPALASRIVRIPTAGEGWQGAFHDGSVVLAAGDYWTSITVDPASGAGCICWMPASATPTIPFGAYNNNFTGQNWLERELYFGFRVFGETAGGVPEPATWAMLILGFGVIGAGMRQPRRRGERGGVAARA